MPDEIEVPLENVHESVQELHEERHGKHAHAHPRHTPKPDGEGEKEKPEGWTRFVAMITAILAVVAAIGALQSGLLVNESLLEKNDEIGKLTRASDTWNYYQAEGLKSLIYSTSAHPDPARAKTYKEKQKDLKDQAEGLEKEAEEHGKKSEHFLDRHHVFAVSVSLCQIAIALSAVAALMRRRAIWIAGVIAGGAGTLLLISGFLQR